MSLTIRERLEKLKETPTPRKQDFFAERFFPAEQKEPPKLSVDSIFQSKLEKAMLNIEKLNKKMTEGSFLALYSELKQAEMKFLELIEESKKRNLMFSDQFKKRVAEIEKKVKRRTS